MRSFVAVACVLLTSGAALLAYVADDAIRTPAGASANLLHAFNYLVPEKPSSYVLIAGSLSQIRRKSDRCGYGPT